GLAVGRLPLLVVLQAAVQRGHRNGVGLAAGGDLEVQDHAGAHARGIDGHLLLPLAGAHVHGAVGGDLHRGGEDRAALGEPGQLDGGLLVRVVRDRGGELGGAVLLDDQQRVAHPGVQGAVLLDVRVGPIGRLVEVLGLHRGHVRATGGRERQAQGGCGEHGTAGTTHGGLLFDTAERRGRSGTALTGYPKTGPWPARPGQGVTRSMSPLGGGGAGGPAARGKALSGARATRSARILAPPLDDRLMRGKGTHHMNFAVGETVVYPHHGAALIEEVKTRTIKGEDRTYLKLKVAQGDLTIEVPADNVDLVGVRDVVDKEGLDEVFDVLRQPCTEEPTNWSRRYKANVEKLASGDVKKVAEVVRDLWRRDQDR